jgi:hypothetical protein
MKNQLKEKYLCEIRPRLRPVRLLRLPMKFQFRRLQQRLQGNQLKQR